MCTKFDFKRTKLPAASELILLLHYSGAEITPRVSEAVLIARGFAKIHFWLMFTFTCFDDVAQLIEQEFIVSSSVQALLYVAVEFVHHTLHICVLVLLDTRHKEIGSVQSCTNTEIEYQNSASATRQKNLTTTFILYCIQSNVTADYSRSNDFFFLFLSERGLMPFTKTKPFIITLLPAPPLDSSSGIPLQFCKEATRSPQFWLELWQAVLVSLSLKLRLCKRQTSRLVRGKRAV